MTNRAKCQIVASSRGPDKKWPPNERQLAMSKTVMIDFPILNDGYTAEDREDYASFVQELGARKGVNHVARYDTIQHLSGSLEGAIGVNLWELETAEQLQSVLASDEYQARIEERDKIHDMDRLTMYLATQTLDEPYDPTKPALLDLVVLNPGQTLDDRAEYAKLMKPIGERYNAKVVKSFTIQQQLRGELPEAVEFNIWELPDAEVFGRIVSDPEYQANIVERDRIHDMGKLTMILATPVT